MKKIKFQSPTGMHDILPQDQKYFQRIYKVAENMAEFYGFRKIDTPILEDAELFSRGVGISTDIVQKEMYILKTRGGDFLALRPEGTAPIMRSFFQQGMFNWSQPVKLWYFGPFFRAENPQAGRYRQFWQIGLEVLEEQNSAIDAQMIQIFYNILQELKIKNLIVEVNSIGDSQCRPYYKKLLMSYLKSRESGLCTDCKRRFKKNPLRVLDCKDERCQQIISQAPQILDHLCDECNNHFKEVLELLDEIGLPYRLNSRLVRGLDYYTKTVFEIFTETVSKSKEQKEEGEEVKKSLALGGGGRYDALAKLIGKGDVPGVGGALGVERIIQAMKMIPVKFSESTNYQVFLAQLGSLAKRKSLKLFEDFRKEKIMVAESFGKDSLKFQLNKANKLGVRYVVIMGQKEALEGSVIVKDMDSGKQSDIKLEKVVSDIKKRLKKGK